MVFNPKILAVLALLIAIQSYADTSPYIQGDRSKIGDYLVLNEFNDQGEDYLSLSLSEHHFSDFKKRGCSINVSVKLLGLGRLNAGFSLRGVDVGVLGKQQFELSGFDVKRPVKVVLRYGNELGTCKSDEYEKLYGVYFEFESLLQFVQSISQAGEKQAEE